MCNMKKKTSHEGIIGLRYACKLFSYAREQKKKQR